MKSIHSLSILCLMAFATGLSGCRKAEPVAPAVPAATSGATGQLLAATVADPAWLARETAAYPLTTCTVSGDKLGGAMGPALDYVYREPGKPDRLIRFCCSDCPPDFKKDPAKFLKMIDDAKAARKS